MANQTRILIASLILVILILGAVVLYSFVIQPKISGYVVSKQNEGVLYTVSSLLTQLQQQQYIMLPTDAEGHYVVLVPAAQQPGLPQQEATGEEVPAQ